ncbi:WhiB family transcriptional regulator, partial [Streptomyces sp. NPDC000963]
MHRDARPGARHVRARREGLGPGRRVEAQLVRAEHAPQQLLAGPRPPPTPSPTGRCGAACPVRTRCLEHALRVAEPYGVWG